jgi:hypothetical protein
MVEKLKRLNEVIIQSINEAISELFSPQVLNSLHKHLNERYGIISDELPYRPETMYMVLDQVFGIKGTRTIERRITAHLCKELGMTFLDTPDCTLPMYVEKAKQLSQTQPPDER